MCYILLRFMVNDGSVELVQIDVIASLLSGRLVRERIGPAMLSAVQNQVSCNITASHLEF